MRPVDSKGVILIKESHSFALIVYSAFISYKARVLGTTRTKKKELVA